MSVQILLVDPDSDRVAQLTAPLHQAGFAVTISGGFEDAMTRVRATPPALVVTYVRLGAYNGLHLIMRARAVHPNMGAILTCAAPDPVLQMDAASFGAEYAVAPWESPRPFVDLVCRVAATERV